MHGAGKERYKMTQEEVIDIMRSRQAWKHQATKNFLITTGLKQRWLLSPYFLTLVLDAITEHIYQTCHTVWFFAYDVVIVGK